MVPLKFYGSTNYTMMTYNSYHPGGCNFLLCDGSVRFIKNAITPGTFLVSTTAGTSTLFGDSGARRRHYWRLPGAVDPEWW